MMKKVLSVLVAAMLLLTATSAFAERIKVEETAKYFDIEIDVPDGAQVDQFTFEGWVCVEMLIGAEGTNRLEFDFSVTPSEEYDGKSLIEYTDEEKALLMAAVGEGFWEPEHEFFLTELGNLVLFTRETSELNDYAVMQTVYKGYFVFLYCGYEDYSPLQDADLMMMLDIMQSAEIIPVDGE